MGSILTLSLMLASAATAPPFPGFPQLDEDRVTSLLVVAEVVEQDYLPSFDACGQPDVVCMDPPPTWFRAKLLERVHGDAPPVVFFAATTSHYGPTLRPAEGEPPVPMLMVLASDGDSLVMPRYSNANVFRDSLGAFHLVVGDEDTVSWLPCGISALVSPINDDALAKSAALSLADHPRYDEGWDPAFFRVDQTHAYPRFSIPVAHLAEWLSAGNATTDLRCSDGADE